MYLKRRHTAGDSTAPFRIPVIQMVASLSLLALFLAFWLQSVYSDETAALREKSGQAFLNAIREMESRHLNAMLGQDFFVRMQDSLDIPVSHNKVALQRMKTDTVFEFSTVTVQPQLLDVEVRRSYDLKISHWEENPEKNQKKMAGSLSLFVFNNDSLHMDSLPVHWRVLRPSLDTVIDRQLLEQDIPVDFKIVEVSDSTRRSYGMLTTSYIDIPTGREYAVALVNYRLFLLGQMLPEYVFSLFLFSVIAMAFLGIYRSMKKQHELTILKNDLISNISHELKTPITTVGVAIEALNRFDAIRHPEKTREYLDIAKQELDRLSLLVEKVLKTSLFERGDQEITMQEVDFKALVESVLSAMKLLFDRMDARVDFQTTGSHFYMMGDTSHLSSVVYNLLDNAIKYAKPDTPPDIKVQLENLDGQLIFSVTDRGIGIPHAYRDQVFAQFFRVPRGDLHPVKGYGLGLSYVAGVVRQHKGKISVAGDEENGTCFTVAFPCVSKDLTA